MKKIVLALVLSTLVLSGCNLVSTPKRTTEEKIQEKIVTKMGTVNLKSGDEYLMGTKEGIVKLTSKKYNLNDYMKQQIKVTGMFSGDILYVDKLERVVID